MNSPHSDVYFMAIQEERRQIPARLDRARQATEARTWPAGPGIVTHLAHTLATVMARAAARLTLTSRRAGDAAPPTRSAQFIVDRG